MAISFEGFNAYFSADYLEGVYRSKVRGGGRGIDGMNDDFFERNCRLILENVSKKIIDKRFSFTKYKLKLISKGRGKEPREISIPTIRDKVVLRALCDCLNDHFEGLLNRDIPQKIIRDVKRDIKSERFIKYMKMDVRNFYPSIRHEDLYAILRNYEVPDFVILLLSGAICSPTVATENEEVSHPNIGVPQGLAISNILASIYMIDLDRLLGGIFGAAYYRYVDDVLCLVENQSLAPIKDRMLSEFESKGLVVHEFGDDKGKSHSGVIWSGSFSYLGYYFSPGTVSVRNGSIEKIRQSIIGIFVSYGNSKKKNQYLLQWRLNLRITGCLFEGRFKGWLFFFSEIDDLPLLYSLDSLVDKMAKRFSVECDFKRFVRAYYEIKYLRYSGDYVPNFDEYPIDEIRRVVTVCWGRNISGKSDDEVSLYFFKKLKNEVKELDTDIGFFGY